MPNKHWGFRRKKSSLKEAAFCEVVTDLPLSRPKLHGGRHGFWCSFFGSGFAKTVAKALDATTHIVH